MKGHAKCFQGHLDLHIIYIYIHIHMCVCVCIYLYIYIYMYIYIYLHIMCLYVYVYEGILSNKDPTWYDGFRCFCGIVCRTFIPVPFRE